LTRQDSGNSIPISDGDILWVEIPDPLAGVAYDGIGATSLNYRVTARGSVPMNETTYWLAFREGTKLYLRGLGELEAGEERQINDETTTALLTFLGFDPEIATSVPYSEIPTGAILDNTYTTADDVVTAVSTNTANINDIATAILKPYNERMDVVAGAPADDNEITGPVAINTNITLPLDSRDGDVQKEYLVGNGAIQLFLNGQYLDLNDDWEEVGAAGTFSQQIKIKQALPIGDILIFTLLVPEKFE
jgi:hypothetical protein